METLIDIIRELEAELSSSNGDYLEIKGIKESYNQRLLAQSQFSGVTRINWLETPIFKSDDKTGIPLTSIQNYLGVDKVLIQAVEEFSFHPTESQVVFNDEIDVFGFRVSSNIYDTSNLGKGVWKYPKLYHPATFSEQDKIVINYSFSDIKENFKLTDAETKAYIQAVVLPQVAELIEADESNAPHQNYIGIRCSKRSIKSISKHSS
jgi:hypothetical protein